MFSLNGLRVCIVCIGLTRFVYIQYFQCITLQFSTSFLSLSVASVNSINTWKAKNKQNIWLLSLL